MSYNPRAGCDVTVSAAGTADEVGIAAAPDLRLVGMTIMESAGSPAAASLNLRHGGLITDPVIVPSKLAASEAKHVTFPEGGLKCPDGIFIERVTGNTTVVLYTKRS